MNTGKGNWVKQSGARIVMCLFAMLLHTTSYAMAFEESGSLAREHVKGELIASVSQAAPGAGFEVLFHQTIDAGWHTYWVSPGDSGAPPDIQWQVPAGVTVTDFRYPFPERIPYGPLMNYGYHDEVYLPFSVFVDEAFKASELTITGEGRVLVCADICIPQKISLMLTLPVAKRSQPSDVAALFDKVSSRIPVPLNVSSDIVVRGDRIEINLGLPVAQNARISTVEYFPYQTDVIENSAEQLFSVTDSGLQLSLVAGYDFLPGESDLSGVLVLSEAVGDGITSAYELTIAPDGATNPGDAIQKTAEPLSTVQAADSIGLLGALFFAFLGGIILNLMPCVFPVLSIKILSLVESVQSEGESIRMHGLAYAFGVIASFVAIAALLLVLRASGEAIGWGFQLQSPLVVSLLAYLFVLIGLNLLGVFEVGLSMMSLGAGGQRGAENGSKPAGYLGSVSTGVLATLVAAPCTAPFMGAAVGFALLQSPITGLLVFASLGAGMALPYVLLCYSPALLARLPRPGNWMLVLKQFLAFPMFASAIWLVWVLGIQAGPTAMMQVLGGALILAVACWLPGIRASSAFASVTRRLIIVVLFLTAIWIATEQRANPVSSVSTTIANERVGLAPGVYSPESLSTALATGPVFVNFTAAWCITCKVNELNALDTTAVKAGFETHGVTYLKADWTNEDPVITAALQAYGRSGVPLYLLYRQGNDSAQVLPQILTPSIVLDALETLE